MKLEPQITNNQSSLIDNHLKRSTTVENSLQINPFYAKQTQFQKWQKNISTIITMRYANLSTGSDQKTKPIQTQFKANKAKNKPNLSQNKPNSKPISNTAYTH
jgi:hypothetical protein